MHLKDLKPMDRFFETIGTIAIAVFVILLAINDIYNGHLVGVLLSGVCVGLYYYLKSK